MGQVKTAEKRHSSGAAYPGMGFGFAYDGIGNRTETTTNGHTANYSVNKANQYTQREIPGLLAIRGSADMQAKVTLNGEPTQRLREYFYGTLEFDNSSSPQYPQIDTSAVKNDAGPSGEDLQATTSGHLYLPKTPEEFIYDTEGNLIKDGRWNYTWDGANQLVAMETPSGVPDAAKRKLEFTYDSHGRRFRKKVSEWQNNDWTLQKDLLFLYDGWNLIAELELDNSTLNLHTSYTWGLDLSGTPQGAGGVGGLLASTSHTGSSPITHLPTYDGNGNIVALIAATDGHTAASYDYGPFGESLTVQEEPGVTNPFRFSSKYRDPESGLLYYGYRYYNAETGRWLSRDPIEERGGVNLYGFNFNSSANYFDRLGLEPAKPPTEAIFTYPYGVDFGGKIHSELGRPTKEQFEELYDVIKKLNEKKEEGRNCWQVYVHLKGPATSGLVLKGSVKCDRVFVIAHAKKQDGNDFVVLADGNLSVNLANKIGKPYGGNCIGIGCNIGDNRFAVSQSGAVQQLIDKLKSLLNKGECPCERICIFSGPVNSGGKKPDFVTEDDLPEGVQEELNKFRKANPPTVSK